MDFEYNDFVEKQKTFFKILFHGVNHNNKPVISDNRMMDSVEQSLLK